MKILSIDGGGVRGLIPDLAQGTLFQSATSNVRYEICDR